MLTIYLTRHGETQWNKENRLQGWKDSPLTDKGIKNAQMLGKRLSKIEFNAIYSSPLKRAFQTAEYIRSGRNIPMIKIENLKEINFGEWEGKKKKELEQTYKKEYSNFWNAPQQYDHQPHKGEGLTNFKHRVEDALKRILAQNPSGNILIVTHSITIKAILSYIMDLPTDKMWVTPFVHATSLTVFHWDGEKFQIVMIADTSHFAEDV